MNWAEAARFGLVGVVQNGCNLASFAGLIRLGADFRVAAIVAALVGLTTSFILNRVWTFRATAHGLGRQAGRYTVVFVAATLAGLALLWVLVTTLDVPEVGAQALAIVIVAPISYLAQRRWSFQLAAVGNVP